MNRSNVFEKLNIMVIVKKKLKICYNGRVC